MAISLPNVPPPPQPSVRRFDEQGRPTSAQVVYETQLLNFFRALKAAIESL